LAGHACVAMVIDRMHKGPGAFWLGKILVYGHLL